MNCDNICNDFTDFYTDHRYKITGKTYDGDAVKTALNIIISTNKVNKRTKAEYRLEITGLNMDRLTEEDKEDVRPTHYMREIVLKKRDYEDK